MAGWGPADALSCRGDGPGSSRPVSGTPSCLFPREQGGDKDARPQYGAMAHREASALRPSLPQVLAVAGDEPLVVVEAVLA